MIKNSLHNVWKSIKMRFYLLLYNARPLVIFELLFNVASIGLISPLIYIFLRFSMRITNNTLLTTENISSFLLNPITLVAILAILFIIAFVSLLDMSAAIYIFECSREQKKTSLKNTIVFAFKNSIRLFLPKNLFIVFVILVILPLISIGANSSFLRQFTIPYKLFEILFSNPLIAIFSIILLIAIFYLGMKFVFAIHYFTLEKLDFIESIKKSWKLLRGNIIRNFISIMTIQIIISLLTKLLDVCGAFIIHQIGSTFGQRSFFGCLFIATSAILFLFLYLVLYALFLPYSCLKISALFYERKKAAKEPIKGLNFKSVVRKNSTVLALKITAISLTLILIAIATGILYFSQTYIITNNLKNSSSREIIAQKSSVLNMRENSLASIENAAFEGANSILVSVQISSDNIAYLNKEPSDKTYEEIKNTTSRALNLQNNNSAENDQIPSLSEAIDCASKNNISLILDISSADHNKDYMGIIFSEISDKNYNDRTIISSTNYSDIESIKHYDASIKTFYWVGFAIGDYSLFKDADIIGLELICIDSETVDDIHSCNKQVVAIEVQSKEKLNRAMNTKVDGIATSHVPQAVELNKNMGLPEFMYSFTDNF